MENANEPSKRSEYQFYLFSKLFDVVIGETDIEYDAIYSVVSAEADRFESSEHNDLNQPEYECIVSYLSEHNERIIKDIKRLTDVRMS